jgi:hypothetical protein
MDIRLATDGQCLWTIGMSLKYSNPNFKRLTFTQYPYKRSFNVFAALAVVAVLVIQLPPSGLAKKHFLNVYR